MGSLLHKASNLIEIKMMKPELAFSVYVIDDSYQRGLRLVCNKQLFAAASRSNSALHSNANSPRSVIDIQTACNYSRKLVA